MTAGAAHSWAQGLRAVWTIARKDIVDGLKNKTILSLIVSMLFLMVFYRLMPVLFSGDQRSMLVVYDAAQSNLVTQLEESGRFDLRTVSSQADLERFIGKENLPVLGLVLPANVDLALAGDEPLRLSGYVDHWVGKSAIAKTRTHIESQIAEIVGKPVQIHVTSGTVYTSPTGMHPWIVSVAILVALTMLGLFVTTHLFVEEREAKTLDVLLVSPASPLQIVCAKALAGTVYCVAGCAVVILFNMVLVVHWGVAILAVVVGALFGVALGLLLGTTFEDKQQITLWGFVLAQPLLLPAALDPLSILPTTVSRVFQFIPTVGLGRVLRLSLSSSTPWAEVLPTLAYVAAWAVGLLALVIWRVQRADR